MLVPPNKNETSETEARGSNTFRPIAGRTRTQQGSVLLAPLRQAVGPRGEPVFLKIPFTTSDLMNWKELAGSYRENPEKVYRSFRTIIENHNPDWQDIQILLNNSFTPEEKKVVLEKANMENEKINAREGPTHFMPTQDPNWNPNSNDGKLIIKQYQQLILFGVKNGISCPKNLAKLTQIIQGKTEDPSTFHK